MGIPDIVYEDPDRDLVLSCQRTYPPAWVSLLERVRWGTQGVVYTMPDIGDALPNMDDPYFLTLRARGELVGVYAFCKRTVRVGERCYPAFYRALLAVEPSQTGRGFGRILVEQARDHFLDALGQQGILYGYIEEENLRSLKISESVGYQAIGAFSVLFVTRFFPRDAGRVERLEASERDTLVRLLNEQYADHALTNFERSVRVGDYYVLRQAGEIVGGLQATRYRWTIERLPGIAGAVLLKALSWGPMARRFADPRKYDFLKLGNLYVRPGHEEELFKLIETLLAQQRLVSGMLFIDRRSPVYQRLARAGRFSWLGAITNVSVRVMAGFKNVSEEEIAEIQRRPLCVSPVDL